MRQTMQLLVKGKRVRGWCVECERLHAGKCGRAERSEAAVVAAIEAGDYWNELKGIAEERVSLTMREFRILRELEEKYGRDFGWPEVMLLRRKFAV